MTVQSSREIRAVVAALGLLLATMATHRAAAVPAQETLAVLIIRATQAAVIIMAAAKQIHRQAAAAIIMAAEGRLLDRSPFW